MWNRIIIVLVFSLNFGIGLNAQKINIDIEAGTINGKSMIGLPLESLTDMLGRPSSVPDNPLKISILGTVLKYHHFGLKFQCKLSEEDYNQPVEMIEIYLSKSWDEEASKFYTIDNISFHPNLNPNYKANQIEEMFELQITEIVTAEQQEIDRKEFFKKNLKMNYVPPPEGGYTYSIYTNFQNHGVIFKHEPITKFLERLTIRNKISKK